MKDEFKVGNEVYITDRSFSFPFVTYTEGDVKVFYNTVFKIVSFGDYPIDNKEGYPGIKNNVCVQNGKQIIFTNVKYLKHAKKMFNIKIFNILQEGNVYVDDTDNGRQTYFSSNVKNKEDFFRILASRTNKFKKDYNNTYYIYTFTSDIDEFIKEVKNIIKLVDEDKHIIEDKYINLNIEIAGKSLYIKNMDTDDYVIRDFKLEYPDKFMKEVSDLTKCKIKKDFFYYITIAINEKDIDEFLNNIKKIIKKINTNNNCKFIPENLK